jgi:hypothetical protein
MTVEEVLIKLGVDGTSVSSGLRGIARQFESFTNGIKNSFKNAFSALAAPLSVAGVIASVKKAVDMAEQIKIRAKDWGTGTGFVQDIVNVGEAAGLSAESIGAVMNKLVASLPAGTDVEAHFMRLADKIGAVQDPALKAKMAVDAFGKSGVDMLRIIGDGSAGLQEMAKAFQKFDDATIEELNRADDQIDRLTNTLVIWAGKFVGGLSFWARTAGAIAADPGKYFKFGPGGGGLLKASADMDAQDLEERQIAEIAQKRAVIAQRQAQAVQDAKDALTAYNAKLDESAFKTATNAQKMEMLEKKWYELQDKLEETTDDKERLKIQEKIMDVEEKRFEINRAITKEREREASAADQAAQRRLQAEQKIADLQRKKDDIYKPNVDELAQGKGRNSDIARRIVRAQDEAKRLWGKGDEAGARNIERMLDGYMPTDSEMDKAFPNGRYLMEPGKLARRVKGAVPSDYRPGLRDRIKGVVVDPHLEKLNELTKQMAELNKKVDSGIPVYGAEE